MNRRVRDKVLRIVGVIMVVLLPVMLALWFAQMRAMSETTGQLQTFAQLALDKTEIVIHEAEETRREAEGYHGAACTPQHQQAMLRKVRTSS
ncbi:CSS-motif domain-containing protein [Trabulsiella odontotermitis]|uniref:CSS-motif domain-containing protein n=1 Tax=Trabulsiella odontotermitis TaxID=379893 RepID=UPI003D2E2617